MKAFFQMIKDTLKAPDTSDVVGRSAIFDSLWYKKQYIDLTQNDVDLADHYVRYGAAERRNPNKFFDTNYYLKQTGEIGEINPIIHYKSIGEKQNINPSPFFDVKYYRYLVGKRAARSNLLEHFLTKGRKKGLQPLHPLSDCRIPAEMIGSKVASRSSYGPIIAIPLYKNASLFDALAAALIECSDELKKLSASILFIVDSPDDYSLINCIKGQFPTLAAITDARIEINQTNIGFVRTCNIAAHYALMEKRDLILLNSDTRPFPGCFEEMCKIAVQDHMIGFVSPRSNNATICNAPVGISFRKLPPEECYQSYLAVASTLEDYDYVPTTVGFALLIKWQIIAEFGAFDPIYGMGYNEENDLIMRANRRGFRSVVANKAFIYHEGEVSFSNSASKKQIQDPKTSRILNERYGEYLPSIEAYFESSNHRALSLLDGIAECRNERKRIGFDWTDVGLYHNGTFRAAREILFILCSRHSEEFECFVIGSINVIEFHALNKISGLNFLEPDSELPLVALIRIGQIFDLEKLRYCRSRAPVFVIFMLDTIALDCLYLDYKKSFQLSTLWNLVFMTADVVFYISEYTKHQFELRFDIPDSLTHKVLLLSTDVTEYTVKEIYEDEGYILIIGNNFLHKGLPDFIEAVKRFEHHTYKYVVLGASGIDTALIKFIETGNLTESEINKLYGASARIVFPSFYEGFGFPIMMGLAHKKPVFARKMPLWAEFIDTCAEAINLHLYDTTFDILTAAQDRSIYWVEPEKKFRSVRWEDSAASIVREIETSLCSLKREKLAEKLLYLDKKNPIDDPGDSDLSKYFLDHHQVIIDRHWLFLVNQIKNRGEKKTHDDEMALIRHSKVFDSSFYVKHNSDVASSGMDPVYHYHVYGWKEFRDPSALFSTRRYVEHYLDTFDVDENPLIHYLTKGIFDGKLVFFSRSRGSAVLPYLILNDESN